VPTGVGKTCCLRLAHQACRERLQRPTCACPRANGKAGPGPAATAASPKLMSGYAKTDLLILE